nr:glycosyltransferase family 39 protein [Mastigocoleus sp. MO_167.B18]
FWHLDLKPLWMDEVITAIFSLGKNYQDLPLDLALPLENWRNFLSLEIGRSCSQIAENLSNQSTHPPLFFCGMYQWLSWVSPTEQDLVRQLRYLPAIFGVLTVIPIYAVNRIAFSAQAGLMAAALMAVSPFGVYLSQEARHYTLPMLLISLSLLGLIKIQRDLIERNQIKFSVWLGWTIVNSIGFYVHYFCILAFIAQITTFIVLMYGKLIYSKKPQEQQVNILPQRKILLALVLSIGATCLSFLPWLPIITKHFTSADTSWLHAPVHIAPIYQTLAGWLVMLIVLPVEKQPLPIAIACGVLMLLFGVWVSLQVFRGLKQLLSAPNTYFSTVTLLSYSIFIILEFFAIAYILGKDITAIPRYNFIYFPSFCALISASLCATRNLNKNQNSIKNKKFNKLKFNKFQFNRLRSFVSKINFVALTRYLVLLIGVISSIFVVNNFAFKKPFLPSEFAQSIDQEISIPSMVVMGYRDNQDVALGLSFALALDAEKEQKKSKITYVSSDSSLTTGGLVKENLPTKKYSTADKFAFFSQKQGFQAVWQKLAELPPPKESQVNLWVIAPGLRRRDYPQQTNLSSQIPCTIDPKQHYRIGVPYQLYRCKNFE